MSSNSSADVKYHLILRISGTAEKISFFHWILRDLDSDWPWGKVEGQSIPICVVCKGGIYRNPRFDVKHIKGLVQQICNMTELPGRLKVKIKQYRAEEKCIEIARDRVRQMKAAEAESGESPRNGRGM